MYTLSELITKGGDEWVTLEYILDNKHIYKINNRKQLERLYNKLGLIRIQIGQSYLYSNYILLLQLNYYFFNKQ